MSSSSSEDPSKSFHVILVTFFLIVLLPMLYSILSRIFSFKQELKNKQNCLCSICKDRIQLYHLKQHKKNYNKTFYVLILGSILIFFLLYNSFQEVQDSVEKINYKNFDPYDVLNVSYSADKKTIKKAYRKLVVKFHPDKINQNLSEKEMVIARKKFIMIVKAYEILTDPVKKLNFEKYGDPDGPSRLQWVVPDFMLNKKFHLPIIILFLIFIMVFLPAVVMIHLKQGASEYDEHGNSRTNLMIYYEYLNENSQLKHIPFIIAASIEFNNTPIRKSEESELIQMFSMCKAFIPKIKEERIPIPSKKAITLLYAWLSRMKFDNKTLEKDTLKIVAECGANLVYKIYGYTSNLINAKQYNKQIKTFGFICLKTIVEFGQCLHQQLWFDFSPFLQLPYFTVDKYLEIKKKNKEISKPEYFMNFISKKMKNKERNNILSNYFSSNEIDDINVVVKNIPTYKIQAKAIVEGYEEILIKDVVSIYINIQRSTIGGVENNIGDNNKDGNTNSNSNTTNNTNTSETIGLGHSQGFSEYYQERVAVFITDKNNVDKLINETTTSIIGNNMMLKVEFMPMKVSKYLKIIFINFYNYLLLLLERKTLL